RPWRGTVGDVDRAARTFAAALRDRGIGPGDAVVLQLPNWVEAAIGFWGEFYAGAIVVPVVHFYGPQELGYIVSTTRPTLAATPDRSGQVDFVAAHGEHHAAAGVPWAIIGEVPASAPANAFAFDDLLAGEPIDGPVAVDAREPALVAFTSGTTR